MTPPDRGSCASLNEFFGELCSRRHDFWGVVFCDFFKNSGKNKVKKISGREKKFFFEILN